MSLTFTIAPAKLSETSDLDVEFLLFRQRSSWKVLEL